jgi:hypothetical protein
VADGEEEDLTDNNGHFKIETWQQFPVQLIVKYKDNPEFKIQVLDASKPLTIRLKTAGNTGYQQEIINN